MISMIRLISILLLCVFSSQAWSYVSALSPIYAYGEKGHFNFEQNSDSEVKKYNYDGKPNPHKSLVDLQGLFLLYWLILLLQRELLAVPEQENRLLVRVRLRLTQLTLSGMEASMSARIAARKSSQDKGLNAVLLPQGMSVSVTILFPGAKVAMETHQMDRSCAVIAT